MQEGSKTIVLIVGIVTLVLGRQLVCVLADIRSAQSGK
jgi:hypothetical protein